MLLSEIQQLHFSGRETNTKGGRIPRRGGRDAHHAIRSRQFHRAVNSPTTPRAFWGLGRNTTKLLPLDTKATFQAVSLTASEFKVDAPEAALPASIDV